MSSVLKKMKNKSYQCLSSKKCQFLLKSAVITSLMVLGRLAFASDSDVDPLAGIYGGLIASLSTGGSIRIGAFIVEGIMAVATYIKTKNLLMMFGGVVAIEIFFRCLSKLIGAA